MADDGHHYQAKNKRWSRMEDKFERIVTYMHPMPLEFTAHICMCNHNAIHTAKISDGELN